MAQVRLAFFLVLLLCMSVSAAKAAPLHTPEFSQWLIGMEQDAVSEGISPQTAQSVLENANFDDHVIELDQKQPETTITFDAYSKRIVSADRVIAGQKALRDNAELLTNVSAHYGVQPEVIVALWGMESSFGHNSGDYSIIDSLVSLAYEGRRAEFFRKELINALKIIDQKHIPVYTLLGSWAGAMGQCQFMPSTYLNYAVSFDGRAPDIWDNTADVFASIANYIVAEGWNGDQTWGREVTLDNSISEDQIGLSHKQALSAWAALGVKNIDGGDLPNKPLEASLIAPDGADGRHFLVYDNFRALMRWNRSTFFATSVGMLADRIKYASP